MRVYITLEHDDVAAALRTFLRTLLTSGRVDALLVPCRLGAGDAIVPALVENANILAQCEPLAPVMPANTATFVSRLTVKDTGRRLGVLLRACEWRALVELTKLQQANLRHVIAIGIDCLGTYETTDYVAMRRAGLQPEQIWQGARTGEPAVPAGYSLRLACQMCEHPVPEGVHIRVGLIGLDHPRELLIESEEEIPLPWSFVERSHSEREQIVASLQERRIAARDRMLAAWRDEVHSIADLVEAFSACIRCHNCMVACPICYCKECIFRTPTFDHDSAQYFRWAERKGALRMPADTLLFHLTRLNHMATSCVGCGMCDSACPNHLPVATLFRAVAQRVQALFDYEAGRSLDEEIPLATFREDELHDLGA